MGAADSRPPASVRIAGDNCRIPAASSPSFQVRRVGIGRCFSTPSCLVHASDSAARSACSLCPAHGQGGGWIDRSSFNQLKP